MNEWNEVTNLMNCEKKINFGAYLSHWFQNTPRRMLYAMSYYKFAAKMICSNKKVLDVGCNEGLGTYLLSNECGFCKGVDFDETAIQVAKKNFQSENCIFDNLDILEIEGPESWDAAVSFDVIEHIYPENANSFFNALKNQIRKEGLIIIGTPSKISQKYASIYSKKGHVNIYDYEKLESEMKKHFNNYFIFAANDEVIHTGFMPLARYYIAIGCNKK